MFHFLRQAARIYAVDREFTVRKPTGRSRDSDGGPVTTPNCGFKTENQGLPWDRPGVSAPPRQALAVQIRKTRRTALLLQRMPEQPRLLLEQLGRGLDLVGDLHVLRERRERALAAGDERRQRLGA